ncbi:hypothetical protein BRC78_07340 [Halobacteriales archaeon QH_8_68_33]|nr:MAG: hypothetical protein BRC78_07340 [Halobacteriales archaeon QH_8_68_33]
MVLLATTSPERAASRSSPSLRDRLRSILFSGLALTIPLIVTLIVLQFVVNFVLGSIGPAATFVSRALGFGQVDPLVLRIAAVGTLVGLVFVVGLVAHVRQGDEIEELFDAVMESIPAIGSVYTSFNEMTDVEYPLEGSYSLAFVTADSPPEVEAATDHEEMQTLFLPMAPNPVMGGYVLHVSPDCVYDVDLSVEEGIRSIVTSGVATGEAHEHDAELVDLGDIRQQARAELDVVKDHARRDYAAVHPDRDPEEVGDDSENEPDDRAEQAGDRADRTDDATDEPATHAEEDGDEQARQ